MITPIELVFLEALEDLAHKAVVDVREFREELMNKCDHPVSRVVERNIRRSNGYGNWHDHKYNICMICQSEDHYGRWVRKEDLRNDNYD